MSDTAVHFHSCAGLTVRSDLRLPLAACPDPGRPPDVCVTRTRIPAESNRAGERGGDGLWARVDGDVIAIRANGLARYRVAKGVIEWDPAPGRKAEEVVGPLMSSVLGALLVQHGFVVLHGGAIALPGGALLVVGHSGAGKSSQVAYHARQGAQVLSDELCALRLDTEGRCWVWPVSPTVTLCDDAARRQGWDDRRSPLRDKVSVCPVSAVPHPMQVRQLVELRCKGSELRAWKPSAMQRLRTVRRHLYLRHLLPLMPERELQHHQCCLQLVLQVECLVVQRPSGNMEESQVASMFWGIRT